MKDNNGIKSLLKDLKRKARVDRSLTDEEYDDLLQRIHRLEEALEKRRQISEARRKSAQRKSVQSQKYYTMLQKIGKMRYPSYLDEFVRAVATPPFSLPGTLFNPEGKEIISIDLRGLGRRIERFQRERAELALAVLFPGSITYRYLGVPVKVSCGTWYQSLRAGLRGIHELSPDRIFQIEVNAQKRNVFKPITLRAMVIPHGGNVNVCAKCLSITDYDEECPHDSSKRRVKLPSSYAIIVRKELKRHVKSTSMLRSPLSLIVPEVHFLDILKVGIAAVGFERTQLGKTVIVDYNPPIGFVLDTKGISFKIDVSNEFIDYILQSRHHIVRDIFVQFLADKISEIMTEIGLPSYHLEIILSSVINALKLEQIDKFDLDKIVENISSSAWIKSALDTVNTEARFYERFDVSEDVLREILENLTKTKVSLELVRKEIKDRLIHTLAHAILIAGCATSGSHFGDLDYIVKEDEVVLLDSVNGGNGSSEMAFEFLSSKEKFSITEFAEEVIKGRTYKPKYFDEALAELLLPCQQGVAERIFHMHLPRPPYREVQRRVSGLLSQLEYYDKISSKLSSIDIRNYFPASIGFHVSIDKRRIRDAERLKEALSICIHGCPDCLAIGTKCNSGAFKEKYHISKSLLDEFFKYKTRNIRVRIEEGLAKVEAKLKENNVVIIDMEVDKHKSGEYEKMMDAVLELNGRKLGERFVKFSGLWVDVQMLESKIVYSAMLVLI